MSSIKTHLAEFVFITLSGAVSGAFLGPLWKATGAMTYSSRLADLPGYKKMVDEAAERACTMAISQMNGSMK